MRRILMVLAAMAMVALAGPAAAAAHHNGDRNRDGLPDKWEKKHHLSLKANQARKDQDRDKLDNKREFELRTDPRKADTDDDGRRDDADSGRIASFTGGVLTITLANGQSVSGQVTPATEIECRAAENENEVENENEDRARAADHGGDDGSRDGGDDTSGEGSGSSGPGSGEQQQPVPAPSPAPTGMQQHSGDGQHGDDNDGHNATPCGQEALTPGTAVHEAELETTASGLVFEKVEVVK
jgi:hypothetical protein